MLKPYTSRIVLIVEHNAKSDEAAREQRQALIARACEAMKDGVTVPVARDGRVHQTWIGRPFGTPREPYREDPLVRARREVPGLREKAHKNLAALKRLLGS